MVDYAKAAHRYVVHGLNKERKMQIRQAEIERRKTMWKTKSEYAFFFYAFLLVSIPLLYGTVVLAIRQDWKSHIWLSLFWTCVMVVAECYRKAKG